MKEVIKDSTQTKCKGKKYFLPTVHWLEPATKDFLDNLLFSNPVIIMSLIECSRPIDYFIRTLSFAPNEV